MISTRIKADRLLRKLYQIRRGDFLMITVDDILAKASEWEIGFYYYYICRGEDHE